MLDKIYGFKDYRVGDNGSWTIEQYEEDGLRYTCNILRDGSVHVFVSTTDKFPKLVDAYEYLESDCSVKGVAQC